MMGCRETHKEDRCSPFLPKTSRQRPTTTLLLHCAPGALTPWGKQPADPWYTRLHPPHSHQSTGHCHTNIQAPPLPCKAQLTPACLQKASWALPTQVRRAQLNLPGVTLNDHPLSLPQPASHWRSGPQGTGAGMCTEEVNELRSVEDNCHTGPSDPALQACGSSVPAENPGVKSEESPERGRMPFPSPSQGPGARASGRAQNRDPRGCSNSIHSCISAALAPV